MVDQLIKNQKNQGAAAQNNPAADKESGGSALNTKTAANGQTSDIIKQQRGMVSAQSSQQLAFNALFKTSTTQEVTKTNVSKGPSSLRQRSTKGASEKHQHKHSHHDESSTSSEVREQMAIRSANANLARNSAGAASRGNSANRGGLRARQPMDGEGPDDDLSQDLSVTLAGQESIEESIATGIRYGTGTDTDIAQQNREIENIATSPEQALNDIELNTSTETIKLLDLVGPEAILTFREKLQQVWVTLDENSSRQLDVIARMPATMGGATATELLMVESPQGIHFVAFLKNRNDFEVLATFDRRALLPENPSRQLIEAGLIGFEQLDTVFKEGGNQIEQKVKELATTKGTNDAVFLGLQKLMVQEKRRRRKFRQMMDYFLDKLDEIDMQGDPDEAPFVPNEFSNESQETDNQEVDSNYEDDYRSPEMIEEKPDDGYGLKNDDSDFH